jgi:hypothetical protein
MPPVEMIARLDLCRTETFWIRCVGGISLLLVFTPFEIWILVFWNLVEMGCLEFVVSGLSVLGAA